MWKKQVSMLLLLFSGLIYAQYETIHFTSDTEYEAIVEQSYYLLSFAPELRMGNNSPTGDWEQGQHDFVAGTPPYGAYHPIGNTQQRAWQNGEIFEWEVSYNASTGEVTFKSKYPSEATWLTTTATTHPNNRTFDHVFLRTFGSVSGSNMRRCKMWDITISKNSNPFVAINDSSYVDTPNTPARDYLWIKNVNIGVNDTFVMKGKGLFQWTGTAPTGSNLATQIKFTHINDRRDYGDAPSSYPEAWMTNIGYFNPNFHYWFYIGTGGDPAAPKIDTDASNQPSANADGDDLDAQGDDEDGIQFLSADNNPIDLATFEFIPGTTYKVQIRAYIRHWGTVLPAYVKGWIDYNKNSSFSDAGESIIDVSNPANNFVSFVTGDNYSSPNPPPAQVKTIDFTIPSNAASGVTYARFILTTNQNLGPHGPSSGSPQLGGEVEDYKLIIRPPMDWGDAPDPGPGTGLGNYRTKDYDDGPRHLVSNNLRLGNLVDTEYNGQPNPGAGGDDTNSTDDEDGLTAPLAVAINSQPTISVRVLNTTGQNAVLTGWIDVNRNGVFEPSERASQIIPTGTNGFINLTFPVISGPAGFTFARFRISTQDDNGDGHLEPIGALNNGEVEDYVAEITLDTGDDDHGDAPSSYGDAAHGGISNSLQLGPVNAGGNGVAVNVDGESMSYYSVYADGDDQYNDNDENGVPSFPVLRTNATSYSLSVLVFNQSGAGAVLVGWIDFNRDGVFTSSEAATVAVPNGTVGPVILTWNGLSGLTAGATYARFRIAPTGAGLSSSTPEGLVMGGEVEDYPLQIENPISLRLTSLTATLDAEGVLITWQIQNHADAAGYHILRSASEHNNYKRISQSLIAVREGQEYYHYLDHAPEGLWYYKVEEINLDGSSVLYGPIAVRAAAVSHDAAHFSFELLQNYPNPFNPTTVISFTLPQTERVTLTVYDLAGRRVKVLINEELPAGRHEAVWDAADVFGRKVAGGAYLYRLEAGDKTLSRLMTVLK